jgi:cobalt-zinc-cadmium efflux system outer membrane protein
VVVAEQLNALLHRAPELPLPAPPASLELRMPDGGARDALLGRALAERPELHAADARVRAREAALDLARREFLPDLRVMGTYDTFWEESELKPMLGIELNLPLRLARREAALEEAKASLEEAKSMRAGTGDQVRLSVGRALERLAEAHHALGIVRDRKLPTARDRVEAARAAFETGQSDFSAAVDAERDLRDAELDHEETLVEVSRRHAELARALGELP